MTEVAATEAPAVEASTNEASVQPSQAPETSNEFSIPSEYAEAGWTQGLDSQEAVWKKLAGSQKLIGDRGAFIPQEGATEDQVNEFLLRVNEKYGEQLKGQYTPSAPENYELGELELPEGVSIDDSINNKVQEIGRNAGLTNDQLNSVRKEWIEHEIAVAAEREQALEAEFGEMAQGLWGNEWTKVTAEAAEVLRNNVPAEMREAMMAMPNKFLVPLVATIKNMGNAQDGIAGSTNGSGQAMTKDEARAKFSELRKKAAQNPAKYREDFRQFQDQYRNLING